MKKRFEAPAVTTADVKNEGNVAENVVVVGGKKPEAPKVSATVADISKNKVADSTFVPMTGVAPEEVPVPKTITITSGKSILGGKVDTNMMLPIDILSTLQVRFTVQEIKNLLCIEFPIVADLQYEEGAKYLKAILKKHDLIRAVVANKTIWDICDNTPERKLDLTKIPDTLRALMVDEKTALETEDGELVLALDCTKVITNCIVPSMIVDGGRFTDYVKISNIKFKRQEAHFLLIFDNILSQGRVNLSSKNFTFVNVSMNHERFQELAALRLMKLDKESTGVRFFKTSNVCENMAGNYAKSQLVAATDGNMMITIPLLRLHNKYKMKKALTGNWLLDNLTQGTSDNKIDRDKVAEVFMSVLDREVFCYQDINDMYVLLNVKKLAMYTLLGQIDEHFKVSVRTNATHISIALQA